MNYLDVRFLGQEIASYFGRFQRTCNTNLVLTNDCTLALNMAVFDDSDLAKMAEVCSRHGAVILSWSAHYPGLYYQEMVVTLHLSEVHKNGKSKND